MSELLLILIVVLILVVLWRGPKNLPRLGEALGRGFKEAKQEATKVQEEIQIRATTDPADRSAPTDPAARPVPPAEDPLTASAPGSDRPV